MEKIEKLEKHKPDELLDGLNKLTDELLRTIEAKYPHLEDKFAEMRKQYGLDNEKIFCECLGDIHYEKGVKLRFPFKPDMYEILEDIERADETIRIDRNKGYCNSKLFNMFWLTNGEPIIILRAYETDAKGGMILSIHQPDHPEWYPTPDDIDEFLDLKVIDAELRTA